MKIFFNGWFWGFMDKTNPGITVDFFLNLFEKVYKDRCEIGDIHNSDILCEFDMLIGCKGSVVTHKKWKHTYLFTGESILRCNPDKYDVVLWGERNHHNVVNLPLFLTYLYTNHFVDQITNSKNVTTVPDKDVCVIISNPNGPMRNEFLNELEKHFQVTYAGQYKNNIGSCIPYQYNDPRFIKFVSQFKFIISMENSRNDTYITEKIIHGLLANIIPVYWGSTRVFDYFNPDRILYLNELENIHRVISEMKELKQNQSKWLTTVNQPNLLNNKLTITIEDVVQDIKNVLKIN
jgi:hypothetical protein